MKKKWAFMILLLGSLGLNAFAFADDGSSSIKVYFKSLKYVFHGVEKEPGENQKGFVYQDVTYVPLRFVSEALGKKVAWDDQTNTIIVESNVSNTTLAKELTDEESILKAVQAVKSYTFQDTNTVYEFGDYLVLKKINGFAFVSVRGTKVSSENAKASSVMPDKIDLFYVLAKLNDGWLIQEVVPKVNSTLDDLVAKYSTSKK